MNILFLTYNFQPEQNFFFGLPFAKELVNRGHQVQVLTTFPNYPSGIIFEGYKNRPIFREQIDGIPIIRVPLYPSHDSSALKRTLSYTSFALSASTIGAFAINKADVAYVVQGPISNGLPAIIIRLLRKVPFVFDIKDLWPDSLQATGMFRNNFGIWAVDRWCKFCYKMSSKITVPTPGIRKILIERSVNPDKIELVYNWYDEKQITFESSSTQIMERYGLLDRFNVVFAGNMGKAQALDKVIGAAEILYKKNKKIQFVFVGDGVEVNELKKQSDKLISKNILFIDRQPVEEIGKILSVASVLLVHLRDEPLFRITIPSKIQAYMAAGKPLLVALKGDASELVEKVKCGLTCDPEDPYEIAQKILMLHDIKEKDREKMGYNGKRYYESNMSFKVAADKFEGIFKEVVYNNNILI